MDHHYHTVITVQNENKQLPMKTIANDVFFHWYPFFQLFIVARLMHAAVIIRIARLRAIYMVLQYQWDINKEITLINAIKHDRESWKVYWELDCSYYLHLLFINQKYNDNQLIWYKTMMWRKSLKICILKIRVRRNVNNDISKYMYILQ